MSEDRRDTERARADGEPASESAQLEPAGVDAPEALAGAPEPASSPPANEVTRVPGIGDPGETRTNQPGPWQQPNNWPAPQPTGWYAPNQWRQPGQWPAPQPTGWYAPNQWQQAGYSPGAYSTPWVPPPTLWPVGYVPWGYTNPPAVPPVLEPPGSFHREVSRRPILALQGRASLRLYALSAAVGLPSMAVLLFFLIGIRTGLTIDSGPIPPSLIVEAVGIVAAIGFMGWAVAQASQRRADGWRDYNGPSPILASGALLALITAIQLPLEFILKALHVDLDSTPATLVLMLLYLVVYVGLVQFLAVRTGSLTWHDIARPRHLSPSWDEWAASSADSESDGKPVPAVASLRSRVAGGRLGNIVIPLLMVFPLIIISSAVESAMLLVLGLHTTDIATDIAAPTSDLDRLLILLAIAIIVPAGEGAFFRGFATNAWGRSMSRNSAILRASLFFAFIHVMNVQTGNDGGVALRAAIFNFGARVPVAIALSWLYMRRRSMLASGILHGGFNGLITVISFL